MISLEPERMTVNCSSLFTPKKKRYIALTWTPDDSRRPSLAALVAAALTVERPLARPGSDGGSDLGDLIPWVVAAKFAQKDVYERLSLPTNAWQCSKRRIMAALSASLPLLPQDCISIIYENVAPKEEQEPIMESLLIYTGTTTIDRTMIDLRPCTLDYKSTN